MQKSLTGSKIAVLVANGFNEMQMTAMQRAFQERGAHVRIIGMDGGLINGWAGDGWGHHYAADHTLNTALAADYDLLVVPGGSRSVEKLKLTAHTKRFVGGFVKTDKPCAILGKASALIEEMEIGPHVLVLPSSDDMDAMVAGICAHFEGGADMEMAA